MNERKTTRITIDLNATDDGRIEALATATGTSTENVIRDALRIYEYLVERHQAGYELFEGHGDEVKPLNLFSQPTETPET